MKSNMGDLNLRIDSVEDLFRFRKIDRRPNLFLRYWAQFLKYLYIRATSRTSKLHMSTILKASVFYDNTTCLICL